MTGAQVMNKVTISGDIPPRTVADERAVPITDAVWELCKRCWTKDPFQRPDCVSIRATLAEVTPASNGMLTTAPTNGELLSPSTNGPTSSPASRNGSPSPTTNGVPPVSPTNGGI
ncbi:hypothetical protein AURDEDRAFT_115994 [Auricularia subglabra TFB-10046 SS5]|nr:hypothetical protein AURDEDRAFT_115994 [Auricularia subglabra TFB-10046 SS5]